MDEQDDTTEFTLLLQLRIVERLRRAGFTDAQIRIIRESQERATEYAMLDWVKSFS